MKTYAKKSPGRKDYHAKIDFQNEPPKTLNLIHVLASPRTVSTTLKFEWQLESYLNRTFFNTIQGSPLLLRARRFNQGIFQLLFKKNIRDVISYYPVYIFIYLLKNWLKLPGDGSRLREYFITLIRIIWLQKRIRHIFHKYINIIQIW